MCSCPKYLKCIILKLLPSAEIFHFTNSHLNIGNICNQTTSRVALFRHTSSSRIDVFCWNHGCPARRQAAARRRDSRPAVLLRGNRCRVARGHRTAMKLGQHGMKRRLFQLQHTELHQSNYAKIPRPAI